MHFIRSRCTSGSCNTEILDAMNIDFDMIILIATDDWSRQISWVVNPLYHLLENIHGIIHRVINMREVNFLKIKSNRFFFSRLLPYCG